MIPFTFPPASPYRESGSEGVNERDVGERPAREARREGFRRPAHRDVGRGEEVLRDPEQLLHFWLSLAQERGDRGAQTLLAAPEQEVLDRQVDRAASDDGEPVELEI